MDELLKEVAELRAEVLDLHAELAENEERATRVHLKDLADLADLREELAMVRALALPGHIEACDRALGDLDGTRGTLSPPDRRDVIQATRDVLVAERG